MSKTSLSSDNSEWEPPESISNSAVKTLSADDSVEANPCESRSSLGIIIISLQPVSSQERAFFLLIFYFSSSYCSFPQAGEGNQCTNSSLTSSSGEPDSTNLLLIFSSPTSGRGWSVATGEGLNLSLIHI